MTESTSTYTELKLGKPKFKFQQIPQLDSIKNRPSNVVIVLN